MNALRNSTDGQIASAVKSVPNVRAINTVLRETGPSAGKAAEELARMQSATAAWMNKAYKTFTDTNAEKVSNELNKVKVYLATDLGASLVNVAAQAIQFAGGMNTITAAIKALIVPIGVATTAWVLYTTVSTAANMIMSSLAGTMGTMTIAASGLAVALMAVAAVSFLDNKLHNQMEKVRRQLGTRPGCHAAGREGGGRAEIEGPRQRLDAPFAA